MAYKVLYRKYRPDSFDKIIGQKNIVDTLKSSIINNNFSHAYLFTGPRGTGKTSTAKVLAKTINCETPVNGEACNQCSCCQNFNTSPDIIEIDAASNNGVDEIRELRNNITLSPSASKYKVYIIDEVHMLTTGAFNALLKTLEEPPAHAIFILATTEVYKVPITILSRCQRYDFKKINKTDMIEHLKYVCNEEEIEFEDEALEEIYSLSEGCLRDALSILDQTSKSSKKLTLESILESYDIISDKTVDKLLTEATAGNIDKIVESIDNFENSGLNAQKLIKKIINYLEKIAINIRLNKEKRFNFNSIKNLIQELNACYIDARINENVYTIIKLSFLTMTNNPSKVVVPTQTVPSAQSVEVKEAKPIAKPEMIKQEVIKKIPNTLKDIRINNCFVGVNKDALNNILSIWKDVVSSAISTINLSDYQPVAASSDYVIFMSEEDSLSKLFNVKTDEIEKYLEKNNHSLKVIAISAEEWNQAKNDYKKNIKNKQKYEFIEEPVEEEIKTESNKKANDLFNNELVEVQ